MKKRTIKIEVYRHRVDGVLTEWRWRARGPNGKVMANGGESYQRRPTMLKSVRRLFPDVEAFPIVDLTGSHTTLVAS